jgi:hypothetical protein
LGTTPAMRDTDLKFWFGLGLALVGLAARALGVPEGLAHVLLFLGLAMMLVSAATWVLRRMSGWPTQAPAPAAKSTDDEAHPSTRKAEENPSVTYVFHGGHHKHITVSEPTEPWPKFPSGSHPADHRATFVRFRSRDLALIDSHNITSVTEVVSSFFRTFALG